MQIGQVIEGTEYGVKSTGYGDTHLGSTYGVSRVVVLGFETSTKRVYHGSRDYRGTVTSFKGVLVQRLDKDGNVAMVPERCVDNVVVPSTTVDSEVIEARLILGTWTDHVDAARQIAERDSNVEAKFSALEARAAAKGVTLYIQRRSTDRYAMGTVHVSSRDIEKLLDA